MHDQLIAYAIMGLGIVMMVGAAVPGIHMRKVGGIRFWRIGRIGGSFYISKRESRQC